MYWNKINVWWQIRGQSFDCLIIRENQEKRPGLLKIYVIF